ncbi:hypothetical protein PCANC_22192 [Puccinia coronata f. sp. avenae]|uniref:Uncharacterized protein n=1 Tax=Puccinia coronata f. sp. avenae TaxID=200324 RepID=A0A2N5S6B5_9BASI|nr:hypothetical protein PCANC_22192 [Puccinia coronata f. sp. avenae]
MFSTSVIASYTVVAAISHLAMSTPFFPITSNTAPNASLNGQGLGASGTGTRNTDSAGLGGNGMTPMANGMATPARNSGLSAGAVSSMPSYASTSQPTSTLPKSQSGMNMNMNGGAMPGNLVGNMAPNSISPGMDTYSQRNRTKMPSAGEIGYSATGADSYGSGTGSYVQNSTVPHNTTTTQTTGTASSASFGYHLIEASGAALAFILFA